MKNQDETTQEKIKRHGWSALLTFVSFAGTELLLQMNGAESWGDINWIAVSSAVTFTAARSTLKLVAGK